MDRRRACSVVSMVDNITPRQRVWADGIVIFGATILATLGVLQLLEGLSALANDDVFVRSPNYLFHLDITGWGWIHLLLGAAGVAIGVSLLRGQRWAMLAGICVAALSAIANFAFLPYYPWWSLILVAFDFLVIWALTVVLTDRS